MVAKWEGIVEKKYWDVCCSKEKVKERFSCSAVSDSL